MANQKGEFRYIKSPVWRVVPASGVIIVGISTPAGGPEVVLHFTMEWLDIEKETFTTDSNLPPGSGPGSVSVKDAPQIVLAPLAKIEEVAVKMSLEASVGLAVGLLSQFPQLSEDQKKRLRDEFAKHQKS
jgi:hypothetical protein